MIIQRNIITTMIAYTFLLLVIPLVSATYPEIPGNCLSCDAYGRSRIPNERFIHRDGCRQYNCECFCDGHWECPANQITDICKSDSTCQTCWAGGEIRQPNQQFHYTEDCYLFNCFCACDGGWNCPKERTIDICNTNITTGCQFCNVKGVRHQGNSQFMLTDECIQYDCVCKCDGGWDCPAETGKDICNTDPDTGCYFCEVNGKRYDGNAYFKYINGCIEYNCVCNCDGSWDCPGDQATDLCKQNTTSGCYYCEIDGYLFQGNSKFDLVRDCYKFSGCNCECDGGWTCKHTTGESICDHTGQEIAACSQCVIDETPYRGNSMFFLQRDCVQYICTCDCLGRYYCPAENARVTCRDTVVDNIASLSSGAIAISERTRPPRQVDVENECGRCYVDGTWYEGGTKFIRDVGCNRFTCDCYCSGEINCPARSVNICGENTISGGGAGLDASSGSRGQGYTVSGISRGSVVGQQEGGGSSVSVCIKCEYLGVVYEGNAPFTFEKGCWQYNCDCNCDGGFNCPSESSRYICDGRRECVRCDLTDYNEGYKDPNTNFQIRRGCDLFENCRCKCDGGWSCDDGVYACKIETGCMVDGRRFASGKTFELTRGCDRYKDCACNDGGDWSCLGQDVEDLCGKCRKCKIGDFYYDGDTQFSAKVNCTSYTNCECNCDGSYECRGGDYKCERGDQPPEGQCSDCLIDGKSYRNLQSFDYTTRCATYRGCQCRCGTTTCRHVTETCGDCRTCTAGGIDYAGGSVFSLKRGCYEYSQCECNCNGIWSCPAEKAVDTCNKCRKCNVEGTLYEAFTKFNLDRKCWNYQCFCLCNGTTWCPSATVVNTCTQPDRCLRCEVDGREIRGNTHFKYELNGMDMHCRCNCDGSHVCVAEWLYVRTDLSISGSGIGSGGSGCFSCIMDGTSYRGDTKYKIIRSGITMDCDCNCDGSYVCYGEGDFAYQGCRGCSLYGRKFDGDLNFPLIYNGLQLSCRCSCDGTYMCLGSSQEIVVRCEGVGGIGCLPENCNQCIVDGVRFNGGDQFGTVYKGTNLRCDCGCDGSYYCVGSGGMIISCVGGRCVELGCSSCDVYGTRIEGGSPFEAYYRGRKLGCQCECGGNYQCYGSSGEVIVECIDGKGCLYGQCRSCEVSGRLVTGLSSFRYDYNGIAMMCTCACDGSYYCEGVSELIQISCIGGRCTRLGCESCSIFGQVYDGDSSFDIIYSGLKLNCKCSCDSGYLCYGSVYEPPVVTCEAGRGRGCLPSTCSACAVNGREYAGGSTFRSVYKGIDVLCTCGCDGSSYCSGITTSIEVSCIGGVCKRIGCQECTLFGKEYIGGSEFDIIYNGARISCECDCDGGYICKSSTGVIIVTCVNGIGAGCLLQRCGQCVVDGRRVNGIEKFQTIFQGINMECTCSCDSSYYCVGVTEQIEISCIGGTCTPVGCKACRLFNKDYPGASNFNLVYAGLLLDCQCLCDGSYLCKGESGTTVIQCRNGRGNCVDQSCRSCEMGGQTFTGASVYRYNYEGVDVSCTCGCDGTVYCTGISIQITISCIGGKCSLVGCRNCQIYGQDYIPLATFDLIYSGYRLGCKCDCAGGYTCEGSTNLVCREGDLGNCLPQTCGRCTLEGQQYEGNSVFKYTYNGIGVSCTCGCDSSIFCVGVTELIELRCIGGSCTPQGCRTCNVFGEDYPAYADFRVIYQGINMNCECACDSSFICLGSTGETIYTCEAGKNCLQEPCRQCLLDNRRYSYRAQFPHKYKDIPMTCTCGCDGTSYCEGTETVIYVSCIGETCSPVNCRSCEIFGQQYQGDSNFDLIYRGTQMDCSCRCDTSYRCEGSSPSDVIDCQPGQSCVPEKCKKCRVNGRRYDGGSTFQYEYQGIPMNCNCGCDGSYYCRGVSIEIIISCQRRGGCRQIGGCRTCSIFGNSYPGGSTNQFVYQGYFMNCECQCDSSYRCLGTKDEVIIECSAGRDCLSDCNSCLIDGREFLGNTEFDYNVQGKNMRCTCGCDGSYYCKCKDDDSEVSCNQRGSCQWIGCNTCLSDGRQRQAYEEFEKIYDGIRMNCLCSCDGSYRCQGVETKVVILCNGDSCSLQGCRSCVVNGREYPSNYEYEVATGSQRQRCICKCDGTSDCSVVENPTCTSCTIDGVTYKGHSRSRVYRGTNPFVCDCYCNGTHVCYPETRPSCRQCSIGGRLYDGNTNFDAVLEGTLMQCNCDCSGQFVCKGDFKTCKGNICTDDCRSCSIDGQQFKAKTNDVANVFGLQMQCQCNCDGSYRCVSDTKICSSNSGCVDNCRQCLIDNQRFDRNPNFQANVFGYRMQCSCDCDGSYRCTSDNKICTSSGCVDNCRQCLIDNQRFDKSPKFQANVNGYRMQCSCDCDGSYRCTSDTKICTLSGCVDNCRQCLIDNQRFDNSPKFQANVYGYRMQCSCDCDGSYRCTSDTKICTSSGCVDNCRQCLIDNQRFDKNSNFNANVFGNRMQCSCDCDGSYRCTSDTKICTSSGCVDNCRQCLIDNRRFDKNPNFQADVFGNRMQCSCDCNGSYQCTSDTKICTLSGCVDNCRQCLIDNQRFDKSPNFQADVYGYRMQCSCDCNGSYRCTSETQVCTSSGCVDNCRQCLIDNQRFDKKSNFKANVFGYRMQCSCDCDGSYRCTSNTKTCTSSGCVDNCRQCLIDNQRFDKSPNFQADVYGYRMQCSCDCDGSYRCTSDTKVCTSSGCVDNCRQCLIDNQRFDRNSNFQADVYGYRMLCSCECDGSYRCTSDSQTCTSSGCVDNCRPCLIDGRRYSRSTNFQADVFGYRMQCSCECDGSYRCESDTRTCSSSAGCVNRCQNCIVNGVRHDGNTNFNAFLEGITMKCTCDCNGNYECRGGNYTCTSRGCVSANTCIGCLIEGRTYPGNTKFETFYRAYGIDMTCECACGGSYTCRGTKEVTSCVGSGCTGSGCNNCVINSIEYKGGTSFQAMIDGYLMDCVCSCNGGYRCTGTRKQNTCYGPGCSQSDDTCTDCIIRGTTYTGNSQFEIDGEAGVRMQCTCDCNGRYTCRGEQRTILCIGPGCEDNRCSACLYDGTEYPGGSVFKTVKNGVNMDCTCACSGEVRCEGTKVIECQGEHCGKGTLGCRRCIIDGRPYSGNTRFTFTKSNLEYTCICFCDGSYNCKGSSGLESSCVGESCAAEKCRNCRLFDKEYQLDARFRLQKNDLTMNCVCECDGAYRCFSVTGTCVGDGCDVYGCKSCTAEGRSFSANSKFELSTGLTCTCECSGEYQCKAKSLQIECVGSDCGVGGCRRCNVDGDMYEGNTRFQIRKYGLLMQCACNCDSSYTCRGYQIISTGQSEVDTGCRQCVINGRTYNGNTRFQVMIDGERNVCSCDCNGRHSCSDSDTGCRACIIGNQRYESNKDFQLYKTGRSVQCRCDCSGNFVCQGQGVGQPCSDGSCSLSCRECNILGSSYNGGQKFTTEADGVTLLCECSCSGEYVCKGYRQVTNVILPSVEESTCDTCVVAGTEHPGNQRFKIQRGCFQIDCICNCDGTWQCPSQTPVYTCSGSVEFGSPAKQQQFYSLTGSIVYPGQTRPDTQQSRLIYTGEEGTVFGSGSGSCRSCFVNDQEYAGNTDFVLQDGCLRWSCACDCTGGWNCSAVTGSECDGPLSPFEPKSCTECEAFDKRYPPNQRFTASDECYRYSCVCNCDGSWECPKESTIKTCVDTSTIYDAARGTCRQCVIGSNSYNYGEIFELVDSCIKYRCTCSCDGSYQCPGSSSVRVCRGGSGVPGRPLTTGSNTISETRRTVVAIRPSGFGNDRSYSESQRNGDSFTSELYGAGSTDYSSNTRAAIIGKGTGSSSSLHGSSSSAVYDGRGQSDSSSTTYSSVPGSSSNTGDQTGRLSLLTGNGCEPCNVDGQLLRGGGDFTYKAGCIEHLCECFCNGTYYCDPEKQVDFCEEDKLRHSASQPKECAVGNRTYKTKLFSYEENCKRYYCRCYRNGLYKCDPKKTREIC